MVSTKLYENRVTLVGNIGRDPLIFNSNNSNTIVRTTLATHYRSRRRDGNGNTVLVDHSDWHRIVLFNPTDNVMNMLKKGNRIKVEGYLHSGSYDKNGNTIYYTEVVANSVTPISIKAENRNENTPANSANVEGVASPVEGTSVKEETYTNKDAIADLLNNNEDEEEKSRDLPF